MLFPMVRCCVPLPATPWNGCRTVKCSLPVPVTIVPQYRTEMEMEMEMHHKISFVSRCFDHCFCCYFYSYPAERRWRGALRCYRTTRARDGRQWKPCPTISGRRWHKVNASPFAVSQSPGTRILTHVYLEVRCVRKRKSTTAFRCIGVK